MWCKKDRDQPSSPRYENLDMKKKKFFPRVEKSVFTVFLVWKEIWNSRFLYICIVIGRRLRLDEVL